ncbi:MAG: hypothetical protein AB1505_20630 [Candidatus Latescibacterota bacterium]
MAFTVHDFQDMVDLLDQHPEWQAELRRRLLSDDFLALPSAVRGLAEAQQRTEETVRLLGDRQAQMLDRQGQMLGELLEMRYARRAPAYFGRLLRRLRTVLPGQLDPAVEDALEARLTPDELPEVLQLDVLAVGRLHAAPAAEAQEVWLAVEVSAVIDRGDVERVQQRSALLRKAGYRVVPVVAGEGLTQGATRLLQDLPVALVLDSRSQGWEEALAAA